MLKKFKNFKKDDEGFSLIELVVAVGIMLVLAAAVMFGYPGIKDWQNNAKIQMAAATAYESGINSITNPWGDLSLEDMRAYVEGEYEDVDIFYNGTTTNDFCVAAMFKWDYDNDFKAFKGACDTWLTEEEMENPRTGNNCSLFSCDGTGGSDPIITGPEEEDPANEPNPAFSHIVTIMTFQCDYDVASDLPIYGIEAGTTITMEGSDGTSIKVPFTPLDPEEGEIVRTGTTDYIDFENEVVYTVTIIGKFGSISKPNASMECLTAVKEIHEESGISKLSFHGASKLTDVPASIPSTVTSLDRGFSGAIVFNDPDVANWDIKNVVEVRLMFNNAAAFNQDISGWDISGITSLDSMFNRASSFNQPLNTWDTSNVTNMGSTFSQASSFNQPLDNWDTSNVNRMDYMFLNAGNFDQDISGWDTSSVTRMNSMFEGADLFSQNLSEWNVSNVTSYNWFGDSASNFPSHLHPRWNY